MERTSRYLAVDVGGTKIEVCVFAADYQLITCATVPTASLPVGGLRFIDGLKALIKQYLASSTVRLGISFNGAVNRGVIVASSILGGFDINYPLEEEFQREFGLAVSLENDVNAQTLAESRLGAGRDTQSLLLINLGTGLRVAFVSQGELLRGFSGQLGEISRSVVYVPALSSSLPLQEILSGKGLVNIYQRLGGDRSKEPREIFTLAESEKTAKLAVGTFREQLAQLLAVVARFYNPERIILAGGVMKSAPVFLPQAVGLYRKAVYPFQVAAVVISELEHGACLGVILDR